MGLPESSPPCRRPSRSPGVSRRPAPVQPRSRGTPPVPQVSRRGAAYLVVHTKPVRVPSGKSHPLPGAQSHRPPPAAPATQAAAQVSHQSFMRGGRAAEPDTPPPPPNGSLLPRPRRLSAERLRPSPARASLASGSRRHRAAPLKASAPPPRPRRRRPRPRPARTARPPLLRSPPSGRQGAEGPGRAGSRGERGGE